MSIRTVILVCLFGFTTVANAATVDTPLILDANSSTWVTPDNSLGMTADFGGTFSQLTSLRFTFNFAGNLNNPYDNALFNPTESFSFAPYVSLDPLIEDYWVIRSNTGDASLASVEIYLSFGPILELLLDGQQAFNFTSVIGVMNISSASIIAEGNFTPSPVPLPPAVWLLATGLVALWTRRRKSMI